MSVPFFKIINVKLAEIKNISAIQVSIVIPEGNTTPEEFADAISKMPDLSGNKIILIEGRAPIWGYGMIMHKAHATPAVACFDPRITDEGGYIVVQSHTAGITVGQVLQICVPA